MDFEANADALGAAVAGKEAADVIDYESALPGASLVDAVRLAETGLARKLARFMFTPEREIDPALPASAGGVDSLVAVEIKRWFWKEIRAELAIFSILGNDDLHTTYQLAVRRSRLWKGEGSDIDGSD